MNQDVLIKALADCLDTLEKFVTAAILLAISVMWTALRNQETLDIYSMKVERRYAFPVLATLYMFLNTAVLILFLRLALLIDLIPRGEEFRKALDTIATHSWILNPYSYFGASVPAILYSSTTYGLLIVVWWLCFASLHALGDSPKPRVQRHTESAFLLIGLAAMGAMQWAGFVMYWKADAGVRGYEGVNMVFVGKAIMSFVSIGLGAILFGLVAMARRRLAEGAGHSTLSNPV
jgi:hypothetical protein